MISSWVAANRCFFKQVDGACVEGSGIDVLFKVSRGQSFMIVIAGFMYAATSLAAIRFLNKGITFLQAVLRVPCGKLRGLFWCPKSDRKVCFSGVLDMLQT